VTDLAQDMRQPVRRYVESISEPIKLIGILAEQSPYKEYAELYSDHIQENCEQDGIVYEPCRVFGSEPVDLQEAIEDANVREDVHGIIVYYPIFKMAKSNRGPYKNRLTGVYYKTHDDFLRDLVTEAKDVEGLSHDYCLRRLFRSGERIPKEEVVFPCTAISVMNILENYHEPLRGECPDHGWEGTTVTILNRSDILGRPLAEMLSSQGASVYSIDEQSILLFRPGGRLRRCTEDRVSMEWCLELSQVVVTGVPSPHFQLPCEFIQPGTTIVNVSEYQNASEEGVLQVDGTRLIPHVGKVTTSVLENNLVALHRRARNKR
jgi:methylenetetrahydrofolate dehydrogenase (NAD+)